MNNIWNKIEGIIKKSNKNVRILEGDPKKGIEECNELHIPLGSILGSVVIHSNGIVIDNWLRIFGQDSSSNGGVLHYNRNSNYFDKVAGMFLVASDVLGGLYAINISRFSDNRNMIWYFAPNSLKWECLELRYDELVKWGLYGNTNEYYSSMRWQNWKEDVKNIAPNAAILVYPFLWTKECDLGTVSKRIVKIDEIIEMNFEHSSILNGQQ